MQPEQEQNKFSIFLVPLSILLSGLLIMVSILFSANNFAKKSGLVKKDDLRAALAQVLNGTSATNTGNSNVTVKTTVDDDPFMGDKSKAKVAIVEFSDFECPFCKQYFDQTYSQIKKDYIDTGKVVYVYRDFPLSFHDPMATYEARAASCVRDQAGDSKYFEFHDLVFKNTTSNGNGLTKIQVTEYARQTGIDIGKYQSCIESDKFNDEIAKDKSDGSKAGVDGTPGFVIGKLDKDGNVEGTLVPGSQAYATFKTVIEEQLAKS
jgi:protein-disulfide isomerase